MGTFILGILLGALLGMFIMSAIVIARVRDCEELAARHNELLMDYERLSGWYARLEQLVGEREP